MTIDINQTDIELLKSNPYQLIISYQALIDSIIYLFVRAGNFKMEDRNEIKQQINEELLRRIPKIQRQFQGRSLLRTYSTVVIRNICNEIIRKKMRNNNLCLEEINIHDTTNETMNSLIIKEEMIRLKKAIGLYFRQRSKLILCLKLRFRMPFNYNDFTEVHSKLSRTDYDKFIEQIGPYPDSSDILIFSALTEILNKYENKNNTPDALRKWIVLKIRELIEVLNGNPPASHYNEETLQILFEKCFFTETEMVSKIFG